MLGIGKFRSTRTVTENYWYRTLTIFVFQYTNNSIMLLIVFNNLITFKSNSSVPFAAEFEEITGSGPFSGEFGEISVRWYLVVGIPIVFAIFLQIFMPHFGLVAQWVKVSAIRCWDRKCSFDKKITKQTTQEEYENLYTGPEFILQLRLAQVLSMMFVTMTYSSVLPILYLVSFLSLLITYWTDKFLILRYFRSQNQFTGDLSKKVVEIIPLAAVSHFIFGLQMFSNKSILHSEDINGFPPHIRVYRIAFIVVISIIIFERPVVAIISTISKSLSKCSRKICSSVKREEFEEKVDENDEVIDAPDFYFEINF